MARVLFAIKSLTVPSGAKVLIEGPSGKGKTTLLHLMAGLLEPRHGSVKIDGREVGRWSESERARFRRENLGIIFQKLNLVSHLTAYENVELGGNSRVQRPDAIRQALERVQLGDAADVLAQNLSMGQQQRVAVARVLAQAPKLVLADEPTSSLDDANAVAVIDALFALAPSTTVIVVSHDHRIRGKFDRVDDFARVVDG